MYFLDITENIIKKYGFKDPLLTRRIIRMFLNEIIEELAKGNDVVIRDFGEFTLQLHKGRKYPNPQGGWVKKDDRVFPKFNFCRSAKLHIAECQKDKPRSEDNA